MDEKKYLNKLLEQLKGFFTLEQDEREDAAQDLNDNWIIDPEKNPEVSLETVAISDSLEILHHYGEDPELYDEIIGQILLDVQRQIEFLETKEKEMKYDSKKEKAVDEEFEDDDDEDLEEDEKNTKYV
jgi:hypothetical protein